MILSLPFSPPDATPIGDHYAMQTPADPRRLDLLLHQPRALRLPPRRRPPRHAAPRRQAARRVRRPPSRHQIEHAINVRKVPVVTARQLGVADVRVAHRPVEHHLHDRQRCEVQAIAIRDAIASSNVPTAWANATTRSGAKVVSSGYSGEVSSSLPSSSSIRFTGYANISGGPAVGMIALESARVAGTSWAAGLGA